jgi:hypothetical protein
MNRRIAWGQATGVLNRSGEVRSRGPLPDGRGSVRHCKNAVPKQSRDRQGAVCGHQPFKSPEPLSTPGAWLACIVMDLAARRNGMKNPGSLLK